MEPISSFATVTMFISMFKPLLIKALRVFWIDEKFKTKKKRDVIIDLSKWTVGIIIALLVNYIGGFGIPLFACLTLGTGASVAAGSAGYRLNKAINGKVKHEH